MKKEELIGLYEEAKANHAKYFVMEVWNLTDSTYSDFFITPVEGLDRKLWLHLNNFTDNLTNRVYVGLKIIRAGYADRLSEIEEKFLSKEGRASRP